MKTTKNVEQIPENSSHILPKHISKNESEQSDVKELWGVDLNTVSFQQLNSPHPNPAIFPSKTIATNKRNKKKRRRKKDDDEEERLTRIDKQTKS